LSPVSASLRQALTERGITPCIPPHSRHPHPARLRSHPLQTASPDREHVCPPQRLATHPHPLWSMRSHLPVSRRRFLHLLDQWVL